MKTKIDKYKSDTDKIVADGGVFRTPQNVLGETFLKLLSAVNYFCK